MARRRWGSTEVLSKAAFADGGTVGRRPTNCTTNPSITVTEVHVSGPGDHIQIAVSATSTCPGVGTPSVQWRYRCVQYVVRNNVAPYAVLATANAWTAFTPITNIRITEAATTNDIPNNTLVTVDILVRRTCANGTRRAWCCRQMRRSGLFTDDSGVGGWAGSFANVAVTAGICDTPAPT